MATEQVGIYHIRFVKYVLANDGAAGYGPFRVFPISTRPFFRVTSQALEVEVVEELQHRAVPVADTRGPRDPPQPGADHVAYIVQRLQDVKEGH